MDANALGALIGGAVLALTVRVFNVVVVKLSAVLEVDAPDPIVDPLIRRHPDP